MQRAQATKTIRISNPLNHNPLQAGHANGERVRRTATACTPKRSVLNRSELIELRDGCRALLCRLEQVVSSTDEPLIPDDLIDLATAARQVRKTKETLRRWCRRHGIGIIAGGRWMVSLQALRKMHNA